MCSGASLHALAPTPSVTDSGTMQTPHMDLEGLHGLHQTWTTKMNHRTGFAGWERTDVGTEQLEV